MRLNQRYIKFPSDTIKFGKHAGSSIKYIIDNHKSYYDWMIKEGMKVSSLVSNYAKGLDIEHSEIRWRIDKKKDQLLIIDFRYWILEKVKFIQGKSIKRKVSENVIETHKINIPFTVRKEKKQEWRDYTKFHNDCELIEWEVEIKEYKQPDLGIFINTCMSKYKKGAD